VPDAPVIWSTSSPVSSRAPWRINTRFDMIDSLQQQISFSLALGNQRIHRAEASISGRARIKSCAYLSGIEQSLAIRPKMGVTKSKPPAVSRLHELKVDEIVAKGQKVVQSSRRLINESRVMTEATREVIKEYRQRKKK
jgi:hypothetical protein